MNSFGRSRSSDLHSSTSIPRYARESTGCIPINKNGHRLDDPLRIPTAAEHNAYKARTKTKKLCSPFYLTNSCPVKSCRYDHTPICALVHHTLRYRLSEWPCRFGGACRRKNCFNGHACSWKRCDGKKLGNCRFDSDMHGVDLEVAEWVKSVGAWGNEVELETTKRKQGVAETNSSDGSMETWPAMVSDLIDV
jgi:hypothetical protein